MVHINVTHIFLRQGLPMWWRLALDSWQPSCSSLPRRLMLVLPIRFLLPLPFCCFNSDLGLLVVVYVCALILCIFSLTMLNLNILPLHSFLPLSWASQLENPVTYTPKVICSCLSDFCSSVLFLLPSSGGGCLRTPPGSLPFHISPLNTVELKGDPFHHVKTSHLLLSRGLFSERWLLNIIQSLFIIYKHDHCFLQLSHAFIPRINPVELDRRILFFCHVLPDSVC